MKRSDINKLRHPTSAEPDMGLTEVNSYAVVVSLANAAENVRIARELFIKKQLEQFRLL